MIQLPSFPVNSLISRRSPSEVFCKKVVLKNFSKFTGKETLTQVFSYEFCEIFKNTYFYRATPVAASEYHSIINAC